VKYRRGSCRHESDSGSKQRVADMIAADKLALIMNARPQDLSLHFEEVSSPVGRLRLTVSDTALVGIWFEQGRDGARPRPELIRGGSPLLDRVRAQLDEYFAGERREFDLPVDPAGGSEFERRVWAALREIPYGETEAYGELATRIDRPCHARAVGAANGRNPIAIVIPCHRVIGANGKLTGYAGGLGRKRLLLDLESDATPLPLPG
jgi:methylated-DNA-[protein]-cysteine S-methyltransferase